jgi:hypothetical protein
VQAKTALEAVATSEEQSTKALQLSEQQYRQLERESLISQRSQLAALEESLRGSEHRCHVIGVECSELSSRLQQAEARHQQGEEAKGKMAKALEVSEATCQKVTEEKCWLTEALQSVEKRCCIRMAEEAEQQQHQQQEQQHEHARLLGAVSEERARAENQTAELREELRLAAEQLKVLEHDKTKAVIAAAAAATASEAAEAELCTRERERVLEQSEVEKSDLSARLQAAEEECRKVGERERGASEAECTRLDQQVLAAEQRSEELVAQHHVQELMAQENFERHASLQDQVCYSWQKA